MRIGILPPHTHTHVYAQSSMPGAFASIRGQQRAKSPTSILQSVMRQYLLKPVAHFNSRVIETTQSTLGSFVSFNTSARKTHGGKKLEKVRGCCCVSIYICIYSMSVCVYMYVIIYIIYIYIYIYVFIGKAKSVY